MFSRWQFNIFAHFFTTRTAIQQCNLPKNQNKISPSSLTFTRSNKPASKPFPNPFSQRFGNFFFRIWEPPPPRSSFLFLREKLTTHHPTLANFHNCFCQSKWKSMPVPRNAGDVFAVLRETQLLVMRSGELRAILNFFRSYFDVGSCRLLLCCFSFRRRFVKSSGVRRSEEV